MNKDQLDELIRLSDEKLRLLSKVVLTGIKPPAGPYAFFHHSSETLERLHDCRLILERLLYQRKEISKLGYYRSRAISGLQPGKPFPPETQIIIGKHTRLNKLMKLDMESLYIFGGILLDQWSLQANIIGGIKLDCKHPFSELVVYLQENQQNPLSKIWLELSEPILWLYYQLRFYRNRFVVHSNRPWQRGTSLSLVGDDFQFFTPSPPGWLDDKELVAEVRSLIDFAPLDIRNADENYWERKNPHALLDRVFNNIGNIGNKDDRERIAQLYGKIGGSTPTFQIIADRLIRFILEGTKLLIPIAEERIKIIDLGKPFRYN